MGCTQTGEHPHLARKLGRPSNFPQTALVPSADSLKHFSEYLTAFRPHDPLVHYPGTPTPADLDVLQQAAPPAGSGLTSEDILALKTLRKDLERICAKAQQRNVKVNSTSRLPKPPSYDVNPQVIIDAEHTWYQVRAGIMDNRALILTYSTYSQP